MIEFEDINKGDKIVAKQKVLSNKGNVLYAGENEVLKVLNTSHYPVLIVENKKQERFSIHQNNAIKVV